MPKESFADRLKLAMEQQGFKQVDLVHAGDRARVQAVLAAICGQTPYKIITGGEAP